MKVVSAVLAAILAVVCLTASLLAQELRVAAAADLSAALPQLAQEFERLHHCKVTVSFGSSGNFYQQLRNGAPFDVFLSADEQYPHALQDAGLTLAGTLKEYATGSLVLWARSDSPFDPAKGVAGLAGGRVKRIAIANPQHAPYGRAARAALQSAGIYEKVRYKLVLGENVSQAATFAQTGNADAGILPLSLAENPAMKRSGRFSKVPQEQYPPIRQAAVAMKSSSEPTLAESFIQYLGSDAAKKILTSFGFQPD